MIDCHSPMSFQRALTTLPSTSKWRSQWQRRYPETDGSTRLSAVTQALHLVQGSDAPRNRRTLLNGGWAPLGIHSDAHGGHAVCHMELGASCKLRGTPKAFPAHLFPKTFLEGPFSWGAPPISGAQFPSANSIRLAFWLLLQLPVSLRHPQTQVPELLGLHPTLVDQHM